MKNAEDKEENNPISILRDSFGLRDRISDFIQTDKIFLLDVLEKLIYKDAKIKGIKLLPKDEILDDILKMIVRKYKHLTLDEINLALEMDRYGDLEKTEHYQFYGTEYVETILKKYCSWKLQKSNELNLIRKANTSKLENRVNIEEIDREYKETILSDIRDKNEYRYINAHLLYKNMPKDFKTTQKEYLEMLEEEKKRLNHERKTKAGKEKDNLLARKILEEKQSIDNLAHLRVQNIIVCRWLEKADN